MVTCAPSRTRRVAVPSPMPLPPPVTSADSPVMPPSLLDPLPTDVILPCSVVGALDSRMSSGSCYRVSVRLQHATGRMIRQSGRVASCAPDGRAGAHVAVSYTHLTLPTKRRV